VVGGLIGYLTAKGQSQVEMARIKADNDRLRAEHDEKHFQHRQGLYHDYLDSAHRFHIGAGGVRPFTDLESLGEFLEELEHRATAVRLFGAEDARQAVGGVEELMDEIIEDAGNHRRAEGGVGPVGRHLINAYRVADRQGRYLGVYNAAVDAMRADVKPR
jgi:hypothetical protein